MILNVDDHAPTRVLNTRVLSSDGYRVLEASTAAEAREHGAAEAIELTLLRMDLADGSGLDVCRRLKTTRPFAAVILISPPDRTIQEAIASGADASLLEPVLAKDLVETVRGFLGHIPASERPDSGWVITDPAGLIEAASHGMERLLNLTVRNLTGRRLMDYFEDRDMAGSLLRGAVTGHGGHCTLSVRPRERAPVSAVVHTSPVAVPGDSLLHVRWAFIVEGRWRRATRSKQEPNSGDRSRAL